MTKISNLEAEAKSSQVLGQPGLHRRQCLKQQQQQQKKPPTWLGGVIPQMVRMLV
jgi:hypothetical protein